MESMQPKARSTASTRMNEPIRVRPSCGSRSNTPVDISTLTALTTRVQVMPGWPNMPGTR
jgi:hypothetical protein